VNRAKTGFCIPVQEWVSNGNQPRRERGLRGWARHLAHQFGFAMTGSCGGGASAIV